MPKIDFDPTVTLGHLISFGSFLAVMILGYVLFDYRINQLETAIGSVNQTLTTVATQQVQIDGLGARVARNEAALDKAPE